jgi:hypothetical protein
MRKLYQDLREALIADDDDKIADASAELEELKESEKLELEDDVDLTDAARKKASEILALFTPRQIAGYIALFADEFPDPAEKLLEGLDAARMKTGQEWDDERDEVSGQDGWLIGGVDKDAETRAREKAAALLDRAHKLKDADFKAQKKDLEKGIKELVASTPPTDVVKNFMARTTAELLSNPRAPAALEARVKRLK